MFANPEYTEISENPECTKIHVITENPRDIINKTVLKFYTNLKNIKGLVSADIRKNTLWQ